MKSYTDIEQSKRLAECLPLVSVEPVIQYQYLLKKTPTYNASQAIIDLEKK